MVIIIISALLHFQYPDTLPEIAIKNPRGLSDQRLQQIEKDLQETAQNNEGMIMLYQLIEVSDCFTR